MPSVGFETVASVREDDERIEDIAEITGLSPRTVRAKLRRAENGRMHVRRFFADRWPTSLEDFGGFTVAQIRRLTLSEELADAAGLRQSRVYKLLQPASGRTRVATVFAQRLGDGSSPRPPTKIAEHRTRRKAEPGPKASKPARREYDSVLDELLHAPHDEVRGKTFELPREFEVPGLYLHQQECLEKMLSQGGSGIVHLPTGAGKTRLAISFMAESLRQDPNRRFLWATANLALIRQAMRAAAECGALFPAGTKIHWLRSKGRGSDSSLFDEAQIVFVMRDDLAWLLGRAADGRFSDAISARLGAEQEVIVVYDECHQLGATRLVKAWKRFHGGLTPEGRRRFRTVGLSATPLPTDVKTHGFLQTAVFPPIPGAPVDAWKMHVYHRVTNEELVERGVLCPVNMHFDRRGIFKIPQALLEKAVGGRTLRLSRSAKGDDLERYAKSFNAIVMSDPRILGFLAERIASNLDALGKTLVFVPNVDAANKLVALLSARISADRVAVVHSRLEELDEDGALEKEEKDPNAIIQEFKRRGDQPCVMVNVGMLTTGFDDPKIRTVILARLTFSTNLFWQMIGRATRGPASGGTGDCYVIDPIRLLEKHAFAEGYRPNVEGTEAAHGESADELGEGGEPPRVPVVDRAPSLTEARPEISAELRAVNAAVVKTIEAFLRGKPVERNALLDAAEAARLVENVDGTYALVPSGTANATESGPSFLLAQLDMLQKRVGKDLSWLHRELPATYTREAGEGFFRKLEIVEKLELYTEQEYRTHEAKLWLAHPSSTTPEPDPKPEPKAPFKGAHLVHQRLFSYQEDMAVEELPTLRAMVENHAASFGGADPARRVAAAILKMLDGYASLSNDERRLVVAAAYYFIEEEDAIPDANMSGFDDDVVAVNYVAGALGRPDLEIN